MPLVSFIVPIYNSMPYLEQCLESLRNQTIQDIEIICVNDCSPDDSVLLVEKIMSIDKRVKLINHTINKRQGGAWNSGVAMATGYYLSFVDADDWLEPDYCEVVLHDDADILCAIYYYRGNKRCKNIDLELYKQYNNDIRKYLLLKGVYFITNFFKRSFLKKNNFEFLENNTYHDFITNLLYFYTDNIRIFDKPGYHYRIDNVSLQRSMNQKSFWGRLEVAKIEYGMYKGKNIYSKYNKEIDYHFYVLYYYNTLIRAFYGYSKLNWKIIKEVKDNVNIFLPSIRTNIYYSNIKKDYSLIMRLPIFLFEYMPRMVVTLDHALYLIIRKIFHK